MNQKQFINTGKEILPVVILKWIWKNLDKIDMIIDFLQSLRTVNIASNPSGCDKSNPKDPHYGEAGEYDEECNWIPWT